MKCPICGEHVYQCETCGGTGTRQEGRYWNGSEYQHYPTMKCPWCVDGMLVHDHGEKQNEERGNRMTRPLSDYRVPATAAPIDPQKSPVHSV